MANRQSLGPEAYRRWRATVLGATTERLEKNLVSRLLGSVRGRRVLDIGTGDGTYAIETAERGAEVIAVDVEPRMLEAARNRADAESVDLELHRADARDLPFADGEFDRVVAVTVLCFVSDVRRAVSEMARVLAPGGRLVIGELARWNVWAVARRLRGWCGSETWASAQFWSRRELTGMLESAGLAVGRVEGAIHYPPHDWAARLFEPIDPVLGRLGAPGAAFLAASARRPRRNDSVAPADDE